MVYFVQVRIGGPIKIGFTEQPAIRFASLRREHAVDLEVLGVMDGDLQVERGLHDRFSGSRLEGEWFRPTDDILWLIAEQARPWDEASETDIISLRSLISLKGTEGFEKWLDGLVEHARQGTRTLLLKNSLRAFAESTGYAATMPKR